MSYRVLVNTRSDNYDYGWLTQNAPNQWWAEGWGKSVLNQAGTRNALQRVNAIGEQPELLLTGIVSGRTDTTSSSRPISYDLLFIPDDDNGNLSRNDVHRALSSWLREAGSHNGPTELGISLDKAIEGAAASTQMAPSQLLDTCLSSESDGTVENDIWRALDESLPAAVKSLPPAMSSDTRNKLVDYLWIGAQHPDVDSVLFGDNPYAYYSMASRSSIDAPTRLGIDHAVTLIAANTEDAGPRRLNGATDGHGPEVVAADPKAPAIVRRPKPVTTSKSNWIKPAIGIATAIALVVVLMRLLVRG